tara:strand:- start:211 stop:537 length:327 start_codon:yes stop_codon:yes gene_type:complete
MVDTKDNSKEEPNKPIFIYEKDGEKIEVDVNTFSNQGKIIFARLLDYQKQREDLQGALIRVQLDIDDNANNYERRKAWIMDNEINKPETVEETDGVEVIDESGEETKQ